MFVLADGRKVDVTHGWGPTQRDLVAAAKAKKAAPGITGSLAQQKTNTKGATTEVVKVSTSPVSNSATVASPGPTSADDSEVAAKFLRLAHDGGCKVFSTVIGPEANDAHRTHFHLDLQERKTSVCE
jgi:Extensin-like protein C-terminus